MMSVSVGDTAVQVTGFRVKATFQESVEGMSADQVNALQLRSAKAVATQLFGGDPVVANAAAAATAQLEWLLRLQAGDRMATVVCYTRALAPDESPRLALGLGMRDLQWSAISR